MDETKTKKKATRQTDYQLSDDHRNAGAEYGAAAGVWRRLAGEPAEVCRLYAAVGIDVE